MGSQSSEVSAYLFLCSVHGKQPGAFPGEAKGLTARLFHRSKATGVLLSALAFKKKFSMSS